MFGTAVGGKGAMQTLSSEDLFEALMVNSTEPVLLTRTDGLVLRANPAACRALGYSEPELLTLSRQALVVRDAELEAFLQQRAREQHARGRVTFVRKDGSTFPSDLTSTVVGEGEGNPISLVTFRDVTDNLRLERELKQSEASFSAAFQTLPDAVTITDLASGRFIAVNEGALRVTGYPEHEMVGELSTSLGLWSDDDRGEFVRQLQTAGAIRDFRTHLRRKDGSTIEVVLSARPLALPGGNLLLTVTRDISTQISAENSRDEYQAQLLQSQKMEALGRLAGGVAHDFNNQLTVILGCCESLEEFAPSEELTDIRLAGQKAAGLTRQLLAFARRQHFSPRLLDVNRVVSESEKLLLRMLGDDVVLQLSCNDGLWPVLMDPVQFEQVVVNLAVNARDAMPGGGTLTIVLSNAHLDEAAAAPFSGAAAGDYVLLSVRDTGQGMPREVQDRAFEPFFTTKPVGKGTGLGLATVHGIVTQSGGAVRIESAPGKGCRFEVLIPRAKGRPEEFVKPVTPRRGGSETILLVEDEPRVRQVMAVTLRKAGYRVLVAHDAEHARELAAREPIALVVSDVVMPLESGPRLVASLRLARPELRALFVSGYADEQAHADAPGLPFLSKPFTPTALLLGVREALDARTEEGAGLSAAADRTRARDG